MNIEKLKYAPIAQRIRIARTEATRLTQAQLAEQLGVVQNQVARWETGEREPKAETLVKIAEILGVTINFLVGDLPRLPTTWQPQLVIPVKDDVEQTAETASKLLYEATDDDMYLDLDMIEQGMQEGWYEFLSGALVQWADGETDESATLDYLMYVK